jgi:CRISPR system Cascade subunit CasE
VTESPLWMVKLHLDAARLARELGRAGLPPFQEDAGILVHQLLAGLFGEGSVQPFRVLDERGRRLPVLGYTRRPEAALREHALTYADPDRYAACDWETFAAKPMPSLVEDARLGFELCSCPVVRLGSDVEVAGTNGEALHYRAGAEIDAWVHERWLAKERGPARSREQVYAQWLCKRLEGAAEVEAIQIESFRRLRLVRRSHGQPRRAKLIERPQALLHGELRVRDIAAFARVLELGIGRHRAYGFGMLLLRPPRRC